MSDKPLTPVKPLSKEQRKSVARKMPTKSPRKFRAQIERDDQRDAARQPSPPSEDSNE